MFHYYPHPGHIESSISHCPTCYYRRFVLTLTICKHSGSWPKTSHEPTQRLLCGSFINRLIPSVNLSKSHFQNIPTVLHFCIFPTLHNDVSISIYVYTILYWAPMPTLFIINIFQSICNVNIIRDCFVHNWFSAAFYISSQQLLKRY